MKTANIDSIFAVTEKSLWICVAKTDLKFIDISVCTIKFLK